MSKLGRNKVYNNIYDKNAVAIMCAKIYATLYNINFLLI